ncbi:polyketide synthase dehydratase domain-containing protein [Streptomyces armeniacus]|uniref:polyketide synthase dehydratase domain-containing protein n=1 Tax=Streptomyces armeniacus TaxID=83291 RepID=UPI001FE8E40A|nr:polyketide synthase dehydratase domain-containing protein [Streptomyces armeniacus]
MGLSLIPLSRPPPPDRLRSSREGRHARIFTGRLALDTHPWLADHAVLDTVILPGTAYVELALHAAHHTGCDRIEDLTLQAPLVLPEQGALDFQVVTGPVSDAGFCGVTIRSRRANADGAREAAWTQHATGNLGPAGEPQPQPAAYEAAWPPAGAQAVSTEGLYERLSRCGLDYGPAFQGLHTAWQHGDTLYAEISLTNDTNPTHYTLHPALLDAALHTLFLHPDHQLDPTNSNIPLPFAWNGVTHHTPTSNQPTHHLRVQLTTSTHHTALHLTTTTNQPLATITNLTTRTITPQQLQQATCCGSGLCGAGCGGAGGFRAACGGGGVECHRACC